MIREQPIEHSSQPHEFSIRCMVAHQLRKNMLLSHRYVLSSHDHVQWTQKRARPRIPPLGLSIIPVRVTTVLQFLRNHMESISLSSKLYSI